MKLVARACSAPAVGQAIEWIPPGLCALGPIRYPADTWVGDPA